MIPAEVKVGLLVRLEAKPGHETEVAQFLVAANALLEGEPQTLSWFAVKSGPTSFAIFDAFVNEHGRQAHLEGKIAAALFARAGDLLAKAPDVQKVDVIASLQR